VVVLQIEFCDPLPLTEYNCPLLIFPGCWKNILGVLLEEHLELALKKGDKLKDVPCGTVLLTEDLHNDVSE